LKIYIIFIENLYTELLYIIYKKIILFSARKFFKENDNSWKKRRKDSMKISSYILLSI